MMTTLACSAVPNDWNNAVLIDWNWRATQSSTSLWPRRGPSVWYIDSACRCKFKNCQHLDEPGCMVRSDWERLPWYAELHSELTASAALAKERAASKKQRQGNVKFKTRGGIKAMEVKLDPKKHRNVSRRQASFLPILHYSREYSTNLYWQYSDISAMCVLQ